MDSKVSKPMDKLWSASFTSACIGNFLLFFAFYLLVPIFPLYLIDSFHTSKSMVGLVLSSYTIAALLIRPISAYILDSTNRKTVYLITFLLFVISFIGYPLASLLSIFLFVRILHGFTFGFVTTAGNSLVVDILPASHRGEGLGYFGIANNLAMAVGPMTSLLMHENYSYNSIFYTAIISGIIGFGFAVTIQSKQKPSKSEKTALTYDRFFLLKGLNAGFCLLLMGIPYGMLVTYVPMYGMELGIKSGIGLFFSLMAVGLVSARLFSGKMVDRGKLLKSVSIGTFICAITFMVLVGIINISIDHTYIVLGLFYLTALMFGIGYGMIFPAYNTLFVDLAPNNRRATASSTYMTSWDVGVGIGLVAGGVLADSEGGLQLAYFSGALSVCFSLLFFNKITAPHFEQNKLR